MNENHSTCALTVYTEQQSNSRNHLKRTQRILSNRISLFFLKRKRIFLLFFFCSMFFVYIGSLLYTFDNGFGISIQKLLAENEDVFSITALLLFVIFSGFSVFGKITSLLTSCFLSFILGILQSVIFVKVFSEDLFLSVLLTFCVVITCFLLLIFTSEVYFSSGRAIIGKKALFSLKENICYILYCLFLSASLAMLFDFIICF